MSISVKRPKTTDNIWSYTVWRWYELEMWYDIQQRALVELSSWVLWFNMVCILSARPADTTSTDQFSIDEVHHLNFDVPATEMLIKWKKST